MKRISFAKSAVVAALVTMCIGVNAQSIFRPIGDVDSSFTLTQVESKSALNGGSFTDIWSFNIVQPLYSTGVLTNLQIQIPNVGYWYKIDNLSIKLYGGVSTLDPSFDPATDTSVLLNTLTSSDGTTFNGTGPYVPGEYFFQIAGKATGISGGQYVFTATTAPIAAVPEPETYAMLLAGLGLIGGIAIRRSKSRDA